jgi:hypothetical protein
MGSVSGFFRELKSDRPSFARAEKWMRYSGYGCLVAAVWNFSFGWFADAGVLPWFWNIGLAVLAAAGVLFILAAGGLSMRHVQGAWLGQGGIVLLLAVMGGFMLWMVLMPGSTDEAQNVSDPSLKTALFGMFVAFVFLQLAIPAGMVFKYLERMKKHAAPPEDASSAGPA